MRSLHNAGASTTRSADGAEAAVRPVPTLAPSSPPPTVLAIHSPAGGSKESITTDGGGEPLGGNGESRQQQQQQPWNRPLVADAEISPGPDTAVWCDEAERRERDATRRRLAEERRLAEGLSARREQQEQQQPEEQDQPPPSIIAVVPPPAAAAASSSRAPASGRSRPGRLESLGSSAGASTSLLRRTPRAGAAGRGARSRCRQSSSNMAAAAV